MISDQCIDGGFLGEQSYPLTVPRLSGSARTHPHAGMGSAIIHTAWFGCHYALRQIVTVFYDAVRQTWWCIVYKCTGTCG